MSLDIESKCLGAFLIYSQQRRVTRELGDCRMGRVTSLRRHSMMVIEPSVRRGEGVITVIRGVQSSEACMFIYVSGTC